jgi:hypothetical protein
MLLRLPRLGLSSATGDRQVDSGLSSMSASGLLALVRVGGRAMTMWVSAPDPPNASNPQE